MDSKKERNRTNKEPRFPLAGVQKEINDLDLFGGGNTQELFGNGGRQQVAVSQACQIPHLLCRELNRELNRLSSRLSSRLSFWFRAAGQWGGLSSEAYWRRRKCHTMAKSTGASPRCLP